MDWYVWTKALHIIAMTAWMAGLFYLPRLFVYHTRHAAGSPAAATFEVMETKLLRIIMNPAMIVTLVSGVALIGVLGWDTLREGWLHAKLGLVLGLVAFHMMAARWRRELASGQFRHSERFYRVANEGPTLLLVGIVVFVVVKPF